MIALRALFASVPCGRDISFNRLPELAVGGVEADSRKVRRGDCFVVINGARQNGARYVSQAIANGARILVSDQSLNGTAPAIPVIAVADARTVLAELAGAFAGFPSKSMRCVGVTGTNGKTTSCYLIEYLLSRAQKKIGVIGTINYRFGKRVVAANQTTPGPLALQSLLARMKKSGCEFVVMEASSHALDQRRVAGIDFEVGLFTNLTQDHLDYHGSMKKYFESKKRLFAGLSKTKTAVINADDPWGRRLIGQTPCRIVRYAIDAKAEFQARNIRIQPGRTSFDLVCGRKTIPVGMPLIGRHNIYNVLGALAVCHALGFDAKRLVPALKDFPGVPGRLEPVDYGQDFDVFIDFAHTPDGLESALKTVRGYCHNRLITVFGCGGDRDRDKRPKMAQVAARYCDAIVVTSDNPRSEKPESIIREIVKGFPKGFRNYQIVTDRRAAIHQAVATAKTGDLLLLAGKGHEQSQIVGNQSVPFCERAILREALRCH